MDDDDGPPIARPVPRRPFAVNLMRVTPPSSFVDDDDDLRQDPSPCLDAGLTPCDVIPPSRPQSTMNLTSSTLMGIFTDAASLCDRYLLDRDDPETPWGTGARTPVKRPGVDDATYELMRRRSHPPRRTSSYRPVDAPRLASPTVVAISRVFRALLLFVLGVGYGVLVSRLHNEQQYLAEIAEGIMKPGTNWRYLAFWGVAGVVLGSLLPWVDRRWDEAFGAEADGAVQGDDALRMAQGRGTDWALVMRAIGAFAGIVFAIRKLPWVSTLQVSATLALVNPLLWWLIDRSKPGFLLSACVGLTGSIIMLGVNPDMMPAPSPSSPATMAAHNLSSSSPAVAASRAPPPVLGGLASQETVETGVWILSALFCSCVCFGNIGRRLAWSRKAGSRGRWGGVR